MFVGDRICDCCDGSDEKPGLCSDTCAKLGEELAAETKRKVEKHRVGFLERTKVVELAVSQLQSLVSETETLQAEVASLKPEVEQLQETKQTLMAELREREAQVAEVPSTPQEPVEFKDPRDPANWELDDEDYDHEAYHGHDDGTVVGQAPAKEEAQKEEDPDEVARRIAAQWTNDPAAAGRSDDSTVSADKGSDAAASTATEPASKEVDATQAAAPSMMQRISNTISNVLGSGASSNGAPAGAGGDAAPAGGSSEQLAVNELRERAHKARDEHDTKKRDLDAKNDRLSSVTARLTQDHGPNQVFMYMYDQCFETFVDKYTYKVCGFGKASQIDKGSETSLGTFEGYNEDHTEMTFTNGAGCWQGPNRSLRVKLECGPKTEILAVDEPSRCVYVANMATPALCTHEALLAAQDELRQLTAL